ncbi:MAG: hypothetical protein AB7F43_05810 [Bacteriovoracia bacterium]
MIRFVVVLAMLLVTLCLTSCGLIAAKPTAYAESGDLVSKSGPVAKTMRKHHAEFADCGRDSISIQTGQEQRLELKFRVGPEGKVLRGIWVEKMVGPDPDLKICLIKVLKKIEFPPPSDGQTKLITYPITLKAEL